MAQNTGDGDIFACRCLNVRVRLQPCQDAPPQSLVDDPEYESVYVGDEGISIVSTTSFASFWDVVLTSMQSHPQLTLRTRCRGVPVPNSKPDSEPDSEQRCNRYMTLSCLVCQMVVYRVLQNILLTMQEKSGPMLPTSDWVEQETLKSATGWIELHKASLVCNFYL